MVAMVALDKDEVALLIQAIGLARVPGTEFSGQEQLKLMELARKLERHQQMERATAPETES